MPYVRYSFDYRCNTKNTVVFRIHCSVDLKAGRPILLECFTDYGALEIVNVDDCALDCTCVCLSVPFLL